MKTALVRLTLASALCLPGAVFLAPSWAASSCDVYSNTPFSAFNGDEVGGTGGRSNCVSTVSLQVKLKYDRFGPDPTTASNGGRIKNVRWTVYGCDSKQSYYVNSSTDTGQSSGSGNKSIRCSNN